MASVEVDSPAPALRSRSPPRDAPTSPRRDRPRRDGGDSYRPAPRERTPPPVRTDEQKQADAKKEFEKLLNARSGGTYIPPARLRALQAQIQQDTSEEGQRVKQRMQWDALKKSINGLINKVNVSNIKNLVPELFAENLVKGRGLFCRSIMKAQASSLAFTPVYSALASIVNSKLPIVGELLVKRLLVQFRKAFRRNDKKVCVASTTFLAHLVNQQVVHEMVALQMLLLLLNKPTDDSVEIAVSLLREVGQFLSEMQPAPTNLVFDRLREILHQADIDKRVQYTVEVMFQIRKDNFKDNPATKEELDLLEEDDMITHQIDLDGDLDVQDSLNIFRYDPDWDRSEEAYNRLKAEILGEDESGSGEDDDDDESSEDEEEQEQKAMEIKDQSNVNLVNLRRTIYLTLMSSVDPEEAVHKLMKINLPPGQEPELPSMIMECCSQEKTYSKFFGLIGERFAKINRLWCDLFEDLFMKTYETIHRYETNRLRNVARFFGHMIASDAIGWHTFSAIRMNEDDTTSSSRIFVKILFQEVAEEMGLVKLKERMKDPVLQPSLEGLFPRDVARNVRFSINYFTSIGMGALTEDMREYLQNMPKPALPAPPAADSDSDSVSSYSSYTGSSYSSRSRSRSRSPKRGGSRDRDRPANRSRSRSRGRSYSRERSSSRSRSYSESVSPPRGRGRRDSSHSRRSPPRRRGSYSSYSDSRSRSRSPSRGPARNRPGQQARGQNARRPPSVSPSRSPSRSPSPVRRRRGSSPGSPPRKTTRGRGRYDDSRSPTPRSPSPISRSPTPQRSSRDDRGRGRRHNSSSISRSPTPRRRSPSPAPGKRRRQSTQSPSRSPSPPPTKRGKRSN